MTVDHNPKKGAQAVGWRIGATAAVLVAVVGLGTLLAFSEIGTSLDVQTLTARIRGFGAWGDAAVVGLMVLHCFVPFPAEILAICAGAVYGPIRGTVLVWIGAMIGASLSFALSRWLGRSFVDALLGPKGQAQLADWTASQGASTLLICRFIPIIAFNMVNYGAGLTRVSWVTFLWTTGIGILPLTALMVWMGAKMVDLTWPWLLAVSAAGIAVVIGGRWWFRSRGR